MNAQNQVVGQIKGMSQLMRPRYSPGLLLRDDDLTQGVDYTRELSRLLFRTILGCGVMCGLEVHAKIDCNKLLITVDEGVALDCHGDPIHVGGAHLAVDPSCMKTELEAPLWIVLRGIDKCCAPRTAVCSSDDDETPSVYTREKAGFELRVLSKRPGCACGCPETTNIEPLDSDCRCVNPELECYVDHYAGKCGCNCAGCSDCDCEWILLARLDKSTQGEWTADHRVRRFIRPVLMRDPLTKVSPKEEKKTDTSTTSAKKAQKPG